jgi:nucleotide-binding universal stress UspA family protein
MFNRILVAVDERGHAEHAVAVAADLAAKCQAQLLLLTVIADSGLVEELGTMTRDEGLYVGEVTQRLLDQVEQVAMAHGARDLVRLDLEGEPAKTILDAATANEADLIVLGAHICRHGTSEVDVPHEVIEHASCACMIVR